MYLEELDLQYLINSVRSVCGKPIFILNPNWSVISCTHQGFTEYARLTMTMGRLPPGLAS